MEVVVHDLLGIEEIEDDSRSENSVSSVGGVSNLSGNTIASFMSNYYNSSDLNLDKWNQIWPEYYGYQNFKIHMSNIGPQSSETMKRIRDLLKGHKDWTKHKDFTKIVMANPRNYFLAHEICHIQIDHISYNELAVKSGVTGLEFHLLGHGIILKDWTHDFSVYSSTVVDVTFDGHFSYVTPAFQIISLLKNLKDVTFKVGLNQQHPFFLEASDPAYQNDGSILDLVPNTCRTLTVYVSPDAHKNMEASGGDPSIVDEILKVILQRAEKYMPSLVKLDLQLPPCDLSRSTFKKIVHNCGPIRKREGSTGLKFEASYEEMLVKCLFEYTPHEVNGVPSRHILKDPIIPLFPNPQESCDNVESIMGLINIWNKIEDSFISLKSFQEERKKPAEIIPPVPPTHKSQITHQQGSLLVPETKNKKKFTVKT